MRPDPPDPGSTRRPGVPALEVVLADGQTWGLALPGPALHPVVGREVDAQGVSRLRVEFTRRIGYPLEVRRWLDQVVASAMADDEPRSRLALVGLASALLRLAHEIEPDQARALLDPDLLDLAEVARGLIPAAFAEPPAGRR